MRGVSVGSGGVDVGGEGGWGGGVGVKEN